MSSTPSAKPATPPGHKPTAVRIPLSDPVAEPAPGDSQSTPHAEQTIAAPVIQATAAPTSADLDAQLAADLDALLQGEFDPIEKVLDEVFDEKAAIVQRAGGLPAERNMSQHSGTVIPATRETIEQLSSRTADAPIPSPAYAAATPPTAAVTAPSQLTAHESAGMASVSTANVPSVPPDVRVEQTVAASARAVSPREAESPKPVAAASHRAADQSRAAVAAVSPAAAATSVSESVVKQSMQTAVMQKREPLRAAQPIVRLLMMMNLPLRKLPRSLRPLMNWAAVTLLLWVPIVWVLAVMNRGAPEHDANAESAGGHATDIVLHDSSRIDEKVTAQPSTSH